MKRLLALLAVCTLGFALQAVPPKTKYICSLAGITTTEFATKEECEKTCYQPGLGAICEKTSVDTKVEDTDDEDMY